MENKISIPSPLSSSQRRLPPAGNSIFDEKTEFKMRVLANHFIDRMLEIRETAAKKGLNINKETVMLIMEHKLD